MKKLLIILLIPILIYFGVYSYKKYTEYQLFFTLRSDIENTNISVKYIDIYKDLYNKNFDEVINIISKHRSLSKDFFDTEKNEESLKKLYSIYENEEFKKVYNIVLDEFKNTSDIQQELTYAFKTIKFYYPSFNIKEVYFIVTGLGDSWYINDDIIVIGLDSFLGDKCQWAPRLPKYLLDTYNRKNISAKIIHEVLNRYIKIDKSNNTLISKVLDYGRLASCTKLALPKVSDECVLEMTKNNFDFLEKNIDHIWSFFVENDLLYNQECNTIRTYVGVGPFTRQLGEGYPGNVGGYLGYKIIKKYVLSNSVNFRDLLEDFDSNKIFNSSNFNFM